jgi:hypothetical protein
MLLVAMRVRSRSSAPIKTVEELGDDASATMMARVLAP